MATTLRNTLSEVMKLAWQFIKKNGYTMSEALKVAWMNIKLKGQMKKRIVKFYFQKMNGEIRQAFGTLMESHIDYTPNGKGYACKDCTKYWDEVKGEWRQFKNYNLIRVA